MKNNRFYLTVLLLLLPFSITTDSEYNESLEDYDGDGLPDAYELANDNDPYDRNDITKDADGDGLTIQEEFIHGTSDQNPDTDFDTLPDAWEIAQGRNPLLADYQISTGAESSCALTDNGVVCWGKDNGSLNVPNLYNPTAVAVGSTFACAMENSEEICWGNNQESLIGKPSLTEGICSIEESGIVCQNDVLFGSPPLIENPAQVSTGESSACALAPDGVTCWGYNLNGENDVPALVIDPDGDGYSNQGGVDAFPLDPTRWLKETKSLGINQNINTHVLGTTHNSNDSLEAFPFDKHYSQATDSRGLTNSYENSNGVDVSNTNFLSNVDTLNISDQYFTDIPNPLTLDWNIYKDYSLGTFEIIDVDQDGLQDLIVHFWKQHTGDEFNGTTPNILKVFKLQDDMTFVDFTYDLLGTDMFNLGGVSRNIEVIDLNRDGKLDVVFSVNQEDGRIDPTNEYSAGQLTAMISTSTGYEIIKFGTASFFHSLGTGKLANGKNFVTGNGFGGGIQAELFSFSDDNEPILNYSGALEIPPNGFRFLNGKKGHSTQLIRNANHPYMFGVIAYELIDDEWTKIDEIDNPYPKIGEVQYKGWNSPGFETVDVLDIGGVPSIGQGGYSYAESCALKVYPEADEIAVLKLNSAEISDFGNQEYYEDLDNFNILMGFEIKNSELIRHPLNIDKETIQTNYNFIDCLDVDGDSYQDIVAYTYGANPSIYINNQSGGFNLLTDSKLPDIKDSIVWPENSAAANFPEASIFRDFTGDGIPDLFFLPSFVPPIDFGNDFADGIGLKFFVGKQFLTKKIVLKFVYADSSTAIAGVKVVMTESDGTVTVLATDANGQITLPSTANTFTLSASLTETGENPITLVDALQIIQYAGELRTLTADQLKAADVNNDGEVGILDALWIVQHLGELRTLDSGLTFLDANTGKALSDTTFRSGEAISISTIQKGDVDGDFDPTLITDHAPIFTGSTTLIVNENETIVADLNGSDSEGDTLTYSIAEGIDRAFFSINAVTGMLSFKTAPNYENPSDDGGNNVYDIVISLNDGINTTVQALTITVADLDSENHVYPDWFSHSKVVEDIELRHVPYNTKINLNEVWYKSLSIPETNFSTTLDTYSFEELQTGGIGYGSHLAFDDRVYVFHSNWAGFGIPANGRAAALVYDNDRNLTDFIYKKIPGGTHQYPLLNSDGTFQVLFPGVDEGELKDGEPGDATSWVFNPSDNTFSEVPINVGCHGSNKFDYEQDGDEDVICQSWGGEFNGKPIIFKNNGLLSFEAVEVESNGVPGHMSASAFYDDDFLNIIYTDTHGVGPAYNIADFTNVIARYLPNDLTKIVDVIELPKPFFEKDLYKDIPIVSEWENSVGLSHDVRSHPIDYDNDGDMDIIIGSLIWAQGHKYGFSIMQFLTNNNGTYVDETEERLFNWSLFSPGTHNMHFYDFNSDGYTDIYAEDAGCNYYGVSGDPIIPDDYLCNGRVLINDGDGHFVVIIETNQLNQLDFIRENYPRWAPFSAFSPKLGMTKNKELFWSSISHDYDKPAVPGGDVVYNGKVDVVTIKLSKKLNTGPNGIDPAERGEPGFNEFYYLLHNNKAKEAVSNRTYANGLEHYIAVGKALGYKINAN